MDQNHNSNHKQYQYMSLPLHAALQQQPPTIIISALIASYPKAISIKCNGELPLHVALKNSASLDVIQTLIVSYPNGLKEVDYEGRKPIEIFNLNKSLYDEKIEERNAIERLLIDGIENIILDENDNIDIDDKKRSSMDNTGSIDRKEESLTTTLREEGWLKVRIIILLLLSLLSMYFIQVLRTYILNGFFLLYKQNNSHLAFQSLLSELPVIWQRRKHTLPYYAYFMTNSYQQIL